MGIFSLQGFKSRPQGFKNLFNHLALPGQEINGEKPWEAIVLRSLDRGRADLRMLVAEKHMTFIKLNGAGERALAEIREGETELGVGKAAVAVEESKSSFREGIVSVTFQCISVCSFLPTISALVSFAVVLGSSSHGGERKRQ